MNARLAGVMLGIRQAIAAVSGYALSEIDDDDDFVAHLQLIPSELEGMGNIIEERFGVDVPDDLFESPLHRTPEAFAEWIIRPAEVAAYAERKRA